MSVSATEYQQMVLGLDRIASVLHTLGNPHHAFKSIHVGGTNGKGTVSRLIHFFLTQQGIKTGLFTSPHLLNACERIQINSDFISSDNLSALMHRIHEAEKMEKVTLTPFEIYTVAAFLAFADARVDMAVIEVGLGGRFDATNVITPLLSLITSIDYDHEEILGQTVCEIAYEKAGIIKKNIPVLINADLPESVRAIFLNTVQTMESPLFWSNTQAVPVDQRNIQMAVDAMNCLNLAMDSTQIDWAGFKNPGRQEQVSLNPLILLDGAHNPAGARFLVEYLRHQFATYSVVFIVGILERKSAKNILKILAECAEKFIFVPVSDELTYSPEALGILLSQENPHTPWIAMQTLASALHNAKQELKPDELICITGSLYLIADAYRAMYNSPKGTHVDDRSLP